MTSYDEFSQTGTTALPHVDMWSDGSSLNNPGPGGYGTVLSYIKKDGEEERCEFSEGFVRTTNNRMELLGAIVGLEALKFPCDVTLVTDSNYVVKAFNEGWVWNWIKKGWITSSKQPVKNVDLWKRLLAAQEPHNVKWVWVQGHGDNQGNIDCDKLANSAAHGAAGPLKVDEGYVDE